MDDYYGDLGDRFFTDFDWSSVNSPSDPSPRATFQLRGEFNHTASTVAHNFVIDFTGLYGEFVEPTNLEQGCIALRLRFNRVTDYRNRPFFDLMNNDEDYHKLFSEYGVTRIFLTRFPPRWVTQRYQISATGKPLLY